MTVSILTSPDSVITRITDRLAQSVGRQKYGMWFNGSTKFDYDDKHHRLDVKVPNRFVADWIGTHFKRQLHEAAENELGNHVNLKVQIDAETFIHQQVGSQVKPIQQQTTKKLILKSAQRNRTAQHRPLRHQLDDFIVGPSNELAFATANQFVHKAPGPANTLFIHGGCGLGKTHLLQGMCGMLQQRQPEAHVHYTTAERFTNEFLGAMRGGRLDSFRKRIRRLDLLAVDDVHFLAGKQATQQEFLHSFDAIDMSGARVLLASDSHPKLIKKFSEALISRCMRGMVVQITTPDTATRIKIIRALSERRGLSVLDSVIQALASRSQGSVRELEGTLNKLHALTMLAQTRKADHRSDTVGHALLNQLFEAEHHEQPTRPVTLQMIIDTVTQHLHVSRDEIMGRCRTRRVVLARSLAVYLARQQTAMSYPELATAMDRPHHSTLISAVQRIVRAIDQNEIVNTPDCNPPMPMRQLVDDIRHAIRGWNRTAQPVHV